MIGIDKAHADLIAGLIKSFKPTCILELGYGDGVSHDAIAGAALYNQNKPRYTLVDSWHDWNFVMPTAVHETIRTHSLNHVTHKGEYNTFETFSIVTSTEEDFVKTALSKGMQYDFIMSDADHQHSHEWSPEVFDKLLASPGILIYHDVDGSYPGLGMLPGFYDNTGYVFKNSTREDEECKRGLLVIFKK